MGRKFSVGASLSVTMIDWAEGCKVPSGEEGSSCTFAPGPIRAIRNVMKTVDQRARKHRLSEVPTSVSEATARRGKHNW